MKNKLIGALILNLMIVGYSFCKVLLVVETGYLNANQSTIEAYADDVRNYDYKTVEVIVPTITGTTEMQRARSLWLVLKNSYQNSNGTIDKLEGAVLIGDLPVAMLNESGYYTAFDYFYMDIWDALSNTAYPNDDMTPWTTVFNNDNGVMNEYIDSRSYSSDGKMDIWVSRVDASNIRFLRGKSGSSAYLQEYQILNEYFGRVHSRMTSSANTPSRGFALGHITNMSTNTLDRLSMKYLNLPFYTEFRNPDNNPFNWMSQLQAGPLGNINLGAYNGVRFPDQQNRRDCTMKNPVLNLTTGAYVPVSDLDNLGYEWAGVFEHSCEAHHSFNATDHFADGGGHALDVNGNFTNCTLGPYWGDGLQPDWPSYKRTGGYLNDYYYFNNQNISTDPYNYAAWRLKSATWRANIANSGIYDVYIYYTALNSNSEAVPAEVYEFQTDASNNLIANVVNNNTVTRSLNQRIHIENTYPGWEPLAKGWNLTAGDAMIIFLSANGCFGDVIADAVWIRNTTNSNYDIFIDNNDIYSGDKGFWTNDRVNRSFESMQDERSDHKAFSKVPFFITNACHINNFAFSSIDNLGNLYALGHSGLISLGTSNNNHAGRTYDVFMKDIAQGKSFGEAFLDQVNDGFWIGNVYALLGAGTLRAQPYIPYNTYGIENQNISTPKVSSYTRPCKISNVTITETGSFDLTSVSSSKTPAQVVIRPETQFKRDSEVRIKLN